MKVQLTFTKEAREEAKEMRTLRGIATIKDFEGPLFENATAFCNEGDQFICVRVWPDANSQKNRAYNYTDYFYAIRSIARYKVFA